MIRHSTARAAIVAAKVRRRPPRVRSISGPNTGATSANGASVSSRYSNTFGRAALLVALKNSVSASDTVTKTSPATPIAYASASLANGGNVVDSSLGRAFVRTTYPHGSRSMRREPGSPALRGRGRRVAVSDKEATRLPFRDAPGRR